MITLEAAQRVAEDWIDAWNSHNLDAILEHYAEDIEFWSPLIAKRMGIASGKIEGKAALRAYFARGLEVYQNLHFTLIQVLPGVDSVTIYYRNQDGVEVAELTVLDADLRATMVRAHYSAASPVWKN